MAQKLLKYFRFEESIRSRLTFSDVTKIRLNPNLNRLQLKQQSIDVVTGNPVYSLDTDLTVTVDATNPDTLRSWLGFAATPRPTLQPANTTVQYKLNDGTDDRYWDGGAWAVAGAADWNDEVTIAGNIATFPASSKTLSVVINLATADRLATPTLMQLDLLMNCDIDYLRSLIADSLIPSLEAGIQPRIDTVVRTAGGTRVSLADLETKYNVASVSAVYDHTDDPNHQTNLFSTFDSDSRLITLTASVTRGKRLWVEFAARPEVYLNWASQDYVEVEKIPAIVLDSFTLTGNEVFGVQEVRNISTLNASVRRSPFRLQLVFDVLLLAEKNRTLLGMVDKALEHAATTRLLRWNAVDEQVSLTMVDEGIFSPRPNLSDRHQSRYSLRLDDVFLWLRPEEVIPLVQQVNLTLSAPELEGGPRYTGVR